MSARGSSAGASAASDAVDADTTKAPGQSPAKRAFAHFVNHRPSWWKKAVFAIALYNLASVPFRFCLESYATLPEVVVDLVLDSVMMVEFVCNMMQTPTGVTEDKQPSVRHILINIRSKTAITEVCVLLPLDAIGLGLGAGGHLMHPAFRLNKMIRLLQLSWYFDQLQEILQISHNASKIFRIVILILWMIYWLGCVYNMVILADGESVQTWYWTQNPGITEASSGYRFLIGVYYTLSTMTGYGTILPQSDFQVLFSITTVFLGVAGNVGVLGTLGSLVQNLDSAGAAFRQKMDAVNDYMRYRKLSPEMQGRIKDYYVYLWQSRRGIDEAELIKELPVYLQEEVSLFLNKEIISKVPLFHECDEQFKTAVVVKLVPLVLLPDSYIVRKGEVGREMFFISRGEVQVVSEAANKADRVVYATLRDGSFFGEVALLFNDSRRTATVIAASYCDLFVLRKEDFDAIQDNFPDQSKAIQKAAQKRYKLQLENEKEEKEDENGSSGSR